MTDSSCDPSPNTGASPSRASLNTLSTSRSRSPYTVGGRTMVQGNAIALTSTSAASLLWPYGVTGDGGRVSSTGAPGCVGPAAASDDTRTKRRGGSAPGAHRRPPSRRSRTPSQRLVVDSIRLVRTKAELQRGVHHGDVVLEDPAALAPVIAVDCALGPDPMVHQGVHAAETVLLHRTEQQD